MATSISVSPNPVVVGQNVTVTWSDATANSVRLGWPCGAQNQAVSGGSGSFVVTVPCAGSCKIDLHAGTAIVACAVLSATTQVIVPPPTGGTHVGWGQTTGGTGGTLFTVSTWPAFKAALLASGKRIIKLQGNAILDAGGDSFSVQNGNVTVDGSSFTGSVKNYSIVWRCSDVFITQMAFKTGEGASSALSTDRRAITFNPPTGQTISGIVLDHCSFAWGPDVVASWLNNTENATAQYCLFGPALYQSNIPSGPNGYGTTMTTSGTSPAYYPKRITWYRNLIIMCERRNLHGESGDYVEMINNAVYDHGDKAGTGNFQHATIVGNMIKKGPETTTSDGWQSELFGGVFMSYFPQSIYFPVVGDTADPSHVNIGINQGGGLFTLGRTFGGSSKRTTPYSITNATVTTPSEALFAQVVAQAGRTFQDPIDSLVKNHALHGTSNGYYNGAGFPAPHPSW